MICSRRALLAWGACALACRASAAGLPVVRAGMLRFGSFSWELDVARQHGFAAASGIEIRPVELATSQAAQVALQAGAVDLILQDWLWVTRQRSAGADWTFVPQSSATGAVDVPARSAVRSLPDLAHRRLGIAGSPLDKSWLILRAYAAQTVGLDLDSAVDKSFGPPPLLDHEMKAGRLDAVLTYWPYAARAEAAGARRLLAVEDAIGALGAGPRLAVVGYVFSQRWARSASNAIAGFLAATTQAREVLRTSDAEWQRLAAKTGAANPGELDRLKAWYRQGIPEGKEDTSAAARLYAALERIGGAALVGPSKGIAPGTFWPSPMP